MAFVELQPGDPAPWFTGRTIATPRFTFETAAGRYLVLCFFGSAANEAGRAALAAIARHRALFDDERLAFFGVSLDPGDVAEGRIAESLPGIRHFVDADAAVSRLYGAAETAPSSNGAGIATRRFWLVLDPRLRVLRRFDFAAGGAEQPALFAFLQTLPPLGTVGGVALQAPILLLPDVFEPALCRHLVELYEKDGGAESGVMREIGGRTVRVHDHGVKRRRDYHVADDKLKGAIQARIRRRVVPEIQRAHQFGITRMERYIVSCYAAADGGHFRPHRDNTTKGTAHRRFAASVNLNDAFEGGEVSFPEYGPRSFKPPPGGAVVFSCSLLHAVSKVTAGRRYAFLPFLYDDAAAKLRAENLQYVGEAET